MAFPKTPDGCLSKLAIGLRKFWIGLGLALLLLVFLEVFCGLGLWVKRRVFPPSGDARKGADAYAGAAWVSDYYDELVQNQVHWGPFVCWRKGPFQGRYINVNSEGLRVTWEPDSSAVTGSIKVFAFGGSTMWGDGARDEFTLASCLAKEFAEAGVGAKVVNYGQPGYVLTQAVLTLQDELTRGNIPDVVVFYCGINEVLASLFTGAAGATLHESNREREFNLLHPARRNSLTREALTRGAQDRALGRVVRGLLRRMGTQPDPYGHLKQNLPKAEQVGQQLQRLVQNHVLAVQAWAKRDGFACFFFWQPVIYYKENLTEYERQLMDNDFMAGYFEEVYRSVTQSDWHRGELPFFDLSGVLAKEQQPLFIDMVHLGEQGNQIMAGHLFGKLVQAGVF